MVNIYDIQAGKFVAFLATELQKMKEFEMPGWAAFVKTSAARERPPVEQDWWYKRAASILRQLYIKGIVGVERLRTRYGGKKDRGSKPEKFYKGSSKIIRVILQQAEKAGFVAKAEKKAGRCLTEKGKEFLDDVAEKATKLA